MNPTSGILYPLFALLAVSTGASAGQVWVVDDDGGAGVDFTDIQPAINAASDGDQVLVKAGTYSSFSLYGKGLHLFADWKADARVQGGFSVRALSAKQHAAIRGLRVVAPVEHGAYLKNNAGEIWIEDCELGGQAGDGLYSSAAFHPEGYAGLLVEGCSGVGVQRSTLVGGAGADYAPLLSSYGNGGSGVWLDDSSLALYDCTLLGGTGGSVFDDDAAWTGAGGGHGLALGAGSLMASGCSFQGAAGGYGGEDFDPFLGYSCGDGGPGGWGIRQTETGGGPAEVYVLDCSTLGGPGGLPMPGSGCSAGQPGGGIEVANGTAKALAGSACGHSTDSPVREGSPVDLDFDGPAGALVVLMLSPAPGSLLFVDFSGTFLVDLVGLSLWPMGVIPPGGTLHVQVPNPVKVAPGQARALFGQAACLDTALPSVVLGGGSQLVILEQAF